MQHLDLSDEEAAALIQELHDIVESDRYPFSAAPYAPLPNKAMMAW
jgi:hypothetical protein